jgi:hypothetical protein
MLRRFHRALAVEGVGRPEDGGEQLHNVPEDVPFGEPCPCGEHGHHSAESQGQAADAERRQSLAQQVVRSESHLERGSAEEDRASGGVCVLGAPEQEEELEG